jgi:hypothetical protein
MTGSSMNPMIGLSCFMKHGHEIGWNQTVDNLSESNDNDNIFNVSIDYLFVYFYAPFLGACFAALIWSSLLVSDILIQIFVFDLFYFSTAIGEHQAYTNRKREKRLKL